MPFFRVLLRVSVCTCVFCVLCCVQIPKQSTLKRVRGSHALFPCGCVARDHGFLRVYVGCVRFVPVAVIFESYGRRRAEAYVCVSLPLSPLFCLSFCHSVILSLYFSPCLCFCFCLCLCYSVSVILSLSLSFCLCHSVSVSVVLSLSLPFSPCLCPCLSVPPYPSVCVSLFLVLTVCVALSLSLCIYFCSYVCRCSCRVFCRTHACFPCLFSEQPFLVKKNWRAN